MTRGRVFWAVIGLLLAGTVALAVVLRGEDPSARATGAPAPASASVPPDRAAVAAAPAIVLIRRRGGVPAAWRARVERTPGVRAVTRPSRGQALLRRAVTARGRVVTAAPDGYAVPLDVLSVEPRGLAALLPADRRAAVTRLRPGTALLSRASARVRRLGPGGRVTLAGGRTLRIAGVLDDRLVRGAELVVTRADGARLGATRSPYLLAATDRPAALLERYDRSGASSAAARLDAPGPARRRGGVARPVELKAAYGEFAVRLPYGADWIGVDPAWRARNVVTRTVPVLGAVTCHRALIAPLRAAMTDLRRRGLARLVDRDDYAGCYAPRRIPGSGALSLHAFGVAVDLNAARNPQFGASRQDPRLVRAMERAGFTWGGRWPTAPDPMHFELQP